MGLKPREYYELTEYEYLCICRGFELKEGRLSHHFRYLSFITINMNVDRQHKVKSPKELWRIPILDGEEKQETEEDQRANFEAFQKAVAFFDRVDKKKQHGRSSST